MLMKPVLHSPVLVADSQIGITAPLFLSSTDPQDDLQTLMSPARRSQEAQLGCLCPPSGLPGTPHQGLQYLPQDTRAPSCLPGWRGKNLVCSCSPGTGRMCWSGACGVAKGGDPNSSPSLTSLSGTCSPSQSWSCVTSLSFCQGCSAPFLVSVPL